MILITGGSGFIGSNFVLNWITSTNEPILVLDKLTYAGNINNLESVRHHPNFEFIRGDICDQTLICDLLKKYQPRALLNFAAESHVDRSIHSPDAFIKTNINGTFSLLQSARDYWQTLPESEKSTFRFLHVSTDEVYGSLNPDEAPFSETRAYHPNNPYSASKAASDHLVRAYHHTYGLPTLITNCSNNYGPFQFPEKLIPFTLLNALNNKPLLVYGDGLHIRDWLFVEDHCDALKTVLAKGKAGETYNIGGNNEITNLELVQIICQILDDRQPATDRLSYSTLITHIQDRPGHDRRYAIDASKMAKQLGWQPKESFKTGITKTIDWYLNHLAWIETIKMNDHYQDWIKTNYNVKETE